MSRVWGDQHAFNELHRINMFPIQVPCPDLWKECALPRPLLRLCSLLTPAKAMPCPDLIQTYEHCS